MLDDDDPNRTALLSPLQDRVSRASLDSFPASDPPSWSSMHAGPPRPGPLGGETALHTPAEVELERLLQGEIEARRASESVAAEAEARREELERVTESRRRLIRGFTHDVKNPLGAADGYLALLQDGILGELTPRQADSVLRVRRSIKAALGLIGKLLDIARAEAGELEIHLEEIDVCATAREVSEDFRAEAAARQLTLTLDETARHALTIRSDHARVRQVLSNLVSNAVKYSRPGGHIGIRVEPRARSDEDIEWAAIDVTDDGPGISPEQQKTLFHEFARFDPNAAQGSGIGLAISERVARALGGALNVTSEIGSGSTFTLWLPLYSGDTRVSHIDA